MQRIEFPSMPLTFQPVLKRARWGGRRLATVLNKPIGEGHDYAESWDIADHGSDQSVVADGPLAGWTLGQLVREYGSELLGEHADRKQFPLLAKFLDANDRLSVQVHPNDPLAHQFDPNENGKTECWIIINAAPGSVVYAGLESGVDRARFEASLTSGNPAACLHRREVVAGDCIFIPAGTVHAIGEGILLAEVQQSSDLTFRLHDWGRLGQDGRSRPLHVEQALTCIDFARGPVEPVVPRVVTDEAGGAVEELVNCEYFIVRRHTSPVRSPFPADNRCRFVMVLAGAATICGGGTAIQAKLGTTVLLPALCRDAEIELQPHSIALEVFVP